MAKWKDDEDAIFGGPDVPEDRHRGFDKSKDKAPQRKNREPQGVRQMIGDQGLGHAMSGYNMAQAFASQQGGHLAGMANQAMGAIARENEKRAAISREMRRMQHEKDMEQMRINALLQRLEMENRSSGSDSMGFAFDPKARRWNRS